MNVRYAPRYLRAFDNLSVDGQEAVVDAVQTFADCVAQGRHPPASLGLRPFRGSRSRFWEFRSTLADRVLFTWETGGIALHLVGSHDELRRFAREN